MLRRWTLAVSIVGALTVALTALYVSLRPRVVTEVRRQRLLPRLESSDPQERISAAWSLSENADPFLVTRIVQGIMGDEPQPDVRAAYVNTLGRVGNPAYLNAVRFATESHQPGIVRAAAWLAWARIDPAGFREQIGALPADTDEWTRIGVAQGRLAIGDLSEVGVLLRFSQEENEKRRYVCTQALWKNVRPLLDAAGRWPMEPRLVEGDPWPLDFARKVARRAADLDLDAIRSDTLPHLQATETLRQTVRRLNGGRERMTRWLFSSNEATIAPAAEAEK